MSDKMTGGCACGRICFEATVNSDEAYLCHCRMCQRASGNVSLAMVGIDQADVRSSHEPDWYQSSGIAERPYCARCGTSLGFRYKSGSEKMDLTVAAFDDPTRFTTSHFGAESLHEAWLDTTPLPRTRSDQYQKLVDRWKTVGEKPPVAAHPVRPISETGRSLENGGREAARGLVTPALSRVILSRLDAASVTTANVFYG